MLINLSREGLKLGYRMSELWWPLSAEEALSKNLVEFSSDGKVALSSEDHAGRLVLHQHRRRIAVCFPLLVKEEPLEGTFEYVWQTQVFSLMSMPPRWRPAVDLLQDVCHMVANKDQAPCSKVHVFSVHAGRIEILVDYYKKYPCVCFMAAL
jgi:hypothetical protein